MQKTHKFLSVILAVLMVFSIMPITASAETYSGTCGDNLTWEFEESTGTLTISGTGRMYDYNTIDSTSVELPWHKQINKIRKIVFDSRVTSIGAGAFERCMLLTELILPNGVKEIGEKAFINCDNLETVVLPDSLRQIGSYGFYGCDLLRSISFGSGIESIGLWAFMDCKKIKDVYIKDLKKWLKLSYEDGRSNPTTYGANLYVNGELLTDLIITADMCPIGNCAMEGCGSLRSVTFPSDLSEIGGNYIFMWCPNLSNVIVPDNITSLGWCTFDGCHALDNIVLGKGIEEIHQFTFNGVYNASIFFTGTEEEWKCIYKSSDNGCIKTAAVHFETTEHTKGTKSWVAKEPTCIYSGEYREQTLCSICGELYKEEVKIIPATGHDYQTVIVAPTCNEIGYTIYTCACGDTYFGDYVNHKGHQYFSEVTTPATHTATGVLTFTCICGDSYTEEIRKNASHEFEAIVTNPTCIEPGYTTFVCECGESYTCNYVSVTTHSDFDENSICDACGEFICDHACHKSGIEVFFWNVICFFSKFFSLNKICECGVVHY